MEKLKYKNKIKILSSLESIKSLNKGRIRSLAPKPSKLIPNDGIAGKYLLIIISLMCFTISLLLCAIILINNTISASQISINLLQTFNIISTLIVILISAAICSVIIFATNAALTSNKEVVQVLNLMGASRNFIAYQIQIKFFNLSILGGIIGCFLTLLTVFAINPFYSQLFNMIYNYDTDIIVINFLNFQVYEYLFILIVPLLSGLIGLVSSRIAIINILK
ncbi:hypothetical protein OAH28_04435 [Hyphomicrobiales bacterium]|nr:hypothetical protein [Hyphomicrobiales bacterium]